MSKPNPFLQILTTDFGPLTVAVTDKSKAIFTLECAPDGAFKAFSGEVKTGKSIKFAKTTFLSNDALFKSSGANAPFDSYVEQLKEMLSTWVKENDLLFICKQIYAIQSLRRSAENEIQQVTWEIDRRKAKLTHLQSQFTANCRIWDRQEEKLTASLKKQKPKK